MIVGTTFGDSGLPGPRVVPKCDGILLWDTILQVRVTLAGGILLDQKEQVLERARRQNVGSQHARINVEMAPAWHAQDGCTQEGVPGWCTGQGTRARQYQGSLNRHFCPESPK